MLFSDNRDYERDSIPHLLRLLLIMILILIPGSGEKTRNS